MPEFVPTVETPFELLLTELREAGSEGLSKEWIFKLFENQIDADDVHAALCDLVAHGHAVVQNPYSRDERWFTAGDRGGETTLGYVEGDDGRFRLRPVDETLCDRIEAGLRAAGEKGMGDYELAVIFQKEDVKAVESQLDRLLSLGKVRRVDNHNVDLGRIDSGWVYIGK